MYRGEYVWGEYVYSVLQTERRQLKQVPPSFHPNINHPSLCHQAQCKKSNLRLGIIKINLFHLVLIFTILYSLLCIALIPHLSPSFDAEFPHAVGKSATQLLSFKYTARLLPRGHDIVYDSGRSSVQNPSKMISQAPQVSDECMYNPSSAHFYSQASSPLLTNTPSV